MGPANYLRGGFHVGEEFGLEQTAPVETQTRKTGEMLKGIRNQNSEASKAKL